MIYLPEIINAVPAKRYLFETYKAVLLHKIRAKKIVQYHYVLLVFKEEEQIPCLAIASEYTDSESKSFPFLCMFTDEGHLNLGSAKQWLVFENFEKESFRLVLDYFKLKNTKIRSEVVPYKPWWKFW